MVSKEEKKELPQKQTIEKESPEGLWNKCSNCKTLFTAEDLVKNVWVCDRCNHHERIGSAQYFQFLFDDGKFKELDAKLTSGDPLKFTDTKKYSDRIKATQEKTGLKDAVRTGVGKLHGEEIVICCMDFAFVGGSMGAVMGEKMSRGIDHAIQIGSPFMIISKSGGARMMEAGLSLMQMAKVSGKLGLLAEEKLPYISYLTDPTTGGVTASFAMLGDLNIAEPGALIGFAGCTCCPRNNRKRIARRFPNFRVCIGTWFLGLHR